MAREELPPIQRVWNALTQLVALDTATPSGVTVNDIAARAELPVQEVAAWLDVLAARHVLYLIHDGTDPTATRAMPYIKPRTSP